MRDFIVDHLVRLNKSRTNSFRWLSIVLGTVLFLGFLPGVLIAVGVLAEMFFNINYSNPVIEKMIVSVTMPLGIAILLWVAVTHWTAGEGTPFYSAPTQRLITGGPYKFCRNPIQLGAILYFWGLGTYLVSVTTGFICFALGLILGTLLHKYIEEKELEIKFGQEYIAYRKRTPFIFPWIW